MRENPLRKIGRIMTWLGQVVLRLLKYSFILLGSMLLLVVIAVFVFFLTPEIHIGSERLRQLTERFAPEWLELKWEQADLRILKKPGLRKLITLELAKPCFDYHQGAASGCFAIVRTGLTLQLHPFRLGVSSIEPLLVLGSRLVIDPSLMPESTEPEPPGPPLKERLQQLALWEVEGSVIEIDSLKVILAKEADGQKEESFHLASWLRFNRDERGRLFGILRVQEAKLLPEGFPSFLGETKLSWPDARSGADRLSQKGPPAEPRRPASVVPDGVGDVSQSGSERFELDSHGQLSLEKRKHIKLNLQTRLADWDRFTYDLRTQLLGFPFIDRVITTGSVETGDVRGKVSLDAGLKTSQVQVFNLVNCDYRVNLDIREAQLQCGPQAVQLGMREHKALSAPHLFRMTPTFELTVRDLNFGGGKIDANWNLDFGLDHLDLIHLELAASGRVEKHEELKWNVKADSKLDIKDFQGLVALLRPTPYAVPAPLNVLRGPMLFTAGGEIDQDGGSLPFRFEPGLKSSSQAIDLLVDGSFRLDRRSYGWKKNLQVSTRLDDLQIAAPRLDVRKIPRFFPDQRFKTLAEKERELAKKEQTNPLQYEFTVRTVRPGAARVLSNFFQEPVDLALNVRATDQGEPTGTFEVLQTKIELLKRDATIRNIRVQLNQQIPDQLNGRISVNYQDYDIQIVLFGPLDKPQITFESDPPLPEDQIIAVLIFGRPLNDLDDDQKTSVASLGAAMADAVLGFSSLYLLASTPIESVGYDPAKGQVVAKVKLDQSTTLELGSGGNESNTLGLRRRLSKRWTVNTYIEKTPETQEQVVSAFLEWVKRF